MTERRERFFIGHLEEFILLILMQNAQSAYTIQETLNRVTKENYAVNTVHTVLSRLQEKGLTASSSGYPKLQTGRRQNIHSITIRGRDAVRSVTEIREQLWYGIIEEDL